MSWRQLFSSLKTTLCQFSSVTSRSTRFKSLSSSFELLFYVSEKTSVCCLHRLVSSWDEWGRNSRSSSSSRGWFDSESRTDLCTRWIHSTADHTRCWRGNQPCYLRQGERSEHWRRLRNWSVCVCVCVHDDSSSPHVIHNRQERWRPSVKTSTFYSSNV